MLLIYKESNNLKIQIKARFYEVGKIDRERQKPVMSDNFRERLNDKTHEVTKEIVDDIENDVNDILYDLNQISGISEVEDIKHKVGELARKLY